MHCANGWTRIWWCVGWRRAPANRISRRWWDWAKHYHKAPDQLIEQEVQDYLFYLIDERKLAWSTCNIATNAFKFFYHVTLKQRAVEFCIPRRRPPSRLPEILSREEVARLIELTTNPKHRVLLMTTYAAGLRVSEVVHLKLTDIDSDRMALRIEQGKGRKCFAKHLRPNVVAKFMLRRPRTEDMPPRRAAT